MSQIILAGTILLSVLNSKILCLPTSWDTSNSVEENGLLNVKKFSPAEDFQDLLNYHVVQFKDDLEQEMDAFLSQKITRARRDATIGIERMSGINLFPSLHLKNYTELSCFLWQKSRFCIFGSSVFLFQNGNAEPFVHNLPLKFGDKLEVYVYEDTVFLAAFSTENYNDPEQALHLFLLLPNSHTLVTVQQIRAHQIKDCVFFEQDGFLHMALAAHLELEQNSKDIGTQCVIYIWTGTTMDVLHEIPSPNLDKISVLSTDEKMAYLLFWVEIDTSIQLWEVPFNPKEARIVEVLDISLPVIHQILVIEVETQSCFLLGGSIESQLYCLIDSKLLLWQVFIHIQTSSANTWSTIQEPATLNDNWSCLLIFNTYKPYNHFEVFRLNSRELFTLTYESDFDEVDCSTPGSLVPFLMDHNMGYLFQTCFSETGEVVVEGFVLNIPALRSHQYRQPPLEDDRLLSCFSNVEYMLEKLGSIQDINHLADNLILSNDSNVFKESITATHLQYNQASLGSIMVMFNYTTTADSPTEMNISVSHLVDSAKILDSRLPDFLYADQSNNTFKGRLILSNVTSLELDTPSINVHKINGRDWTQFTENTWRYSIDQEIGHDVFIDEVESISVDVHSNASGSVIPSNWFLNSGGKLAGPIYFDSFVVHGNLSNGNNSVNEVDISDTIVNSSGVISVKGVKSFSEVNVLKNIDTNLVNDRNFRDWADQLVLQRSDDEQYFTGTVNLVGPVRVDDTFECESINGINIADIPHLLVNKYSDQIITGQIRFTKNLTVVSAHLDLLNGISVDDLLSTSSAHQVQATLNVETLEIGGDLDCPSTSLVDLSDLLFTDDSDSLVLNGPVLFTEEVVVAHLAVEDGHLNDLDVNSLLNPTSLRIDSKVVINMDMTLESLTTPSFNNVDPSNLLDIFWTKSTDQRIDVDVYMSSAKVIGNVSAQTLMGLSLNKSFYHSSADEIINVDVTFEDLFAVGGNLTIDQLDPSTTALLHSFENDVVRNEGQYHINGTKVFNSLIIHGNLTVDTFNKLNVPDDVFLLNRPQKLSNVVFNSDVLVRNNMSTQQGNAAVNFVSDFLLDDLIDSALMLDDVDVEMSGRIQFKERVVVEDLIVENFLNGLDIHRIAAHGLRKTGGNQQISQPVTLNGNLEFMDAATVITVNKYDVNDYLKSVVNVSNPGTITGTKKVKAVKSLHDVDMTQFNDLALDFSNILTATENQSIFGRYSFNRIEAEAIDVNSINFKNLSEFARAAGTSEVQIISGELELDEMAVSKSLRILSQTLNGCNLTSLMDAEDVEYFEFLEIVNGTLILEQPSMNNQNLSSLLGSVRKDRNQTFAGAVTFLSGTYMKDMNVPSKLFGRVDLDLLFNHALLKSTDQDLFGIRNYSAGISIEELEHVGHLQLGFWNDNDVEKIVSEVVLSTGVQRIDSKKHIRGSWNITGNLNVSGSVDSVPVEMLVPISTYQLPNGTEFTDLEVKAKLDVGGLIDEVNLMEMLSLRVPLKEDSVIHSNILFNTTIEAGNITVTRINNVNVDDLVLKTAAPGQVINGTKNFKKSLEIQGDVVLSVLNHQILENVASHVVEIDQDVEFERPVVFRGNLEVLNGIQFHSYNGANVTELPFYDELHLKSGNTSVWEDPFSLSILSELDRKSISSYSDFEFFELVQEIPLDFPYSTYASLVVKHCLLPHKTNRKEPDVANALIFATHSTDGESCGLNKSCRCFRSQSLPLDDSGRSQSLEMNSRLQGFVKSRQTRSTSMRLFNTGTFFFAVVVGRADQQCTREKLSIVALNPITFQVVQELVLELDDHMTDIEMKQTSNESVTIAFSQNSSGIQIYRFNGKDFQYVQSLGMTRAVAVDMIFYTDKDNETILFLAAASNEFEANSAVWTMESNNEFKLLKLIPTFGALDVLFTQHKDHLYLTYAQDPIIEDQYSGNWSLYSVPAQVLLYTPSTNNFNVFQHLDLNRVTSLTNLKITDLPFMAVATSKGRVRIYRLVKGQGFQAVQTFQSDGVQSIEGYSSSNETYLSIISQSKVQILTARVRGLYKPRLDKD